MARKARFTVTMTPAPTSTVTVDYETVPFTAVAPSDFTVTSGTLTFTAGQTSKVVDVPVRDDIPGNPEEQFRVVLSNPVGCTIGDDTGIATLPGAAAASVYVDRFNWIYENLHDAENGYFGPPTGAKARTVPYHVPEKVICEAPDWGHESVSETASFWIGLEAWKGLLSGNWDGYNAAWNSIEANFIPSATNQPVGGYSAADPADYTPEGDLPSAYPTLGDSQAEVGSDPLSVELAAAYGNSRMYLMHWLVDVDGKYGFHNGDAAEVCVFINNYQRGLQESAFETVTHPSWEDFDFGGTYGFLPLFSQGLPTYPAAEFAYSKQWRYTCAPDAEARVVQYAWWAQQFAAEAGSAAAIAAADAKAKKMGDYLRYSLFDKYFRTIGDDRDTGGSGTQSCHYLISWYVSWGGEVPAPSQQPQWGFRIGSSECHQGYQAPDIAYFMATGGGGYTPLGSSAGTMWLTSLRRQMEMLRWLQSPEGPIAGGVSNSWKGRYETPADGRQNAQFYGMDYTYAPVWHDPPSNNWFGFQCWGLQRLADLFLEVSDKSTALANEVRPQAETILDRFIVFVLDQVTLDAETNDFSLPDTLSWVSETEVVGETATAANLEGVYEFLPSLDWDGTGDEIAFWDPDDVPNPTLHCAVERTGHDIGVASCLASLLIHYAEAKRRLTPSKFTDPIGASAHTAEDAYLLAKALLDRIWAGFRDEIGIAVTEPRADYVRMGDVTYIPTGFSGLMPNGDVIEPGVKFHELRSFIELEPEWTDIAAYIADPVNAPAPEFTYHRFWAQCEYAMACAAMHRYLGDIAEA